MDDMIEKVARVIGEHYDGYADPVETPDNWARAVEAARAALLALREPTEGMVHAGGEPMCTATSLVSGQMYWDADGPFYIWQAMIDAALGSQTQEKGNE